MRARRVLILGGTEAARVVAGELVAQGHMVTTSLAGVTRNPVLPAGEVRFGGFGGVQGLRQYIGQYQIELVIDATHPFAERISANADDAARELKVDLVRLEQPPWTARAGDNWQYAANTEMAARLIPRDARALLTIGRKELALFAAREDVRVLARMIEAPEHDLPSRWDVVRARPPFKLDDEIALMQREAIDVLVTKNAGGPGRAKLDAARELALPVIMIERPLLPDVPVFRSTGEVAAYVSETQ